MITKLLSHKIPKYEDGGAAMMKKATLIVSIDNDYELASNFFNMLFLIKNISEYEIIVVSDNCENYKTIMLLQEYDRKGQIKLIELTERHGFGRANNIGVKISTTQNLIFINTDVILVGNELDELLQAKEKFKCKAIQPLLLYPQTGKIQSAGHIFGTLFNRHALENNDPAILDGIEAVERSALTIAFCLIEKDIFMQYEGFNEFYYNAYEGLELTARIHYAGLGCKLIPSIKAYHIRQATRKNIYLNEEQQTPYFWTNCTLYIKEDYSDFIVQYLSPALFAKNYTAVSFTHLDLIPLLQKAGLHISETINIQLSGNIELFNVLPYTLLKSPSNYLFVCENFTQITSNKLWFQLRKNRNDIVVDSNGNVISLSKFLQI